MSVVIVAPLYIKTWAIRIFLQYRTNAPPAVD